MEFPMHGNFYAPYRCASQRNMEYERSLFPIVLLLKGTWTFPCSVSLYLSKEHWNFYIPHRCASQRSMEILCSSSLHCCASQRNIEFSMFHTVVSLEGTWNVFWSLSFYYSKEHSKFYAPQRYAFQRNMEISLLIIVYYSNEHGYFYSPYRCSYKETMKFLCSLMFYHSK